MEMVHRKMTAPHIDMKLIVRDQINSLPAKSVLAGTKLVLFGGYVLKFYVGIVQWILREMKTWCATIYLMTQRTNRRILTSAKKTLFWPSTHVIDAASFVKIASNSKQAEVIRRSTRYQTLWTDKNSARNYSTMKLVQKWSFTKDHNW